jgi:hypothetical protein
MAIPSPRSAASAADSGNSVSVREQGTMKREREEWDNEGGAVRLPTHAGTQASPETRKLADILPPPIMANRRKGILRLACND